MKQDRRSFLSFMIMTSAAVSGGLLSFVQKASAQSPALKRINPLSEYDDSQVNSRNENPLGSSPKAKVSPRSSYEECDIQINQLKNTLGDKENFSTDDIFIGPGSRHIIFEVLARARSQGFNKLIFPIPDYGLVASLGRVTGYAVTRVPVDSDKPGDSLKLLENRLKGKHVVYFSNPHLPYGTFHEKGVIENLLKKYPQSLFLVDEAYIEFVGEDYLSRSAKNLVEKYPNLIVIRTFSKIYGLSGHRVGYALTKKRNIEKFLFPYRHSRMISQVSAQAAREALLDTSHLEKTRSYVKETAAQFLDQIKEDLKDIQVIPTRNLFLTFATKVNDQNKFLEKTDIMDKMWEQHHLDYWQNMANHKLEFTMSVTNLEKMKKDWKILKDLINGKIVL